jgi:hypothetical protein
MSTRSKYQPKHTPHQRIVRAARRGQGCYLTPDDCIQLEDGAIGSLAANDDRYDAERRAAAPSGAVDEEEGR